MLRGSRLGGIVESGDGGVGLTLAKVLASGGVGVAEADDGDVALVRAAIAGADGRG